MQAEFTGGDITSDGGALLLRQIDRRLGLMKAVDAVIPDPRNPDYITHTQLSLLRQRVYGLGLGYEDLNDHKTLRNDPALQTAVSTAVSREQELGSQSTLCRLEGRAGRKAAVDIHKVLIDQFIASFDSPPDNLILDFDATDDPVSWHAGGALFPWLLRPLLLSPPLCLLWRSVAAFPQKKEYKGCIGLQDFGKQ
ncbi:MAG: transposase [Candidatus Marinimicrobia bacterium]|nr:transposase [Candidatus Neomarinimicrobiota bacterium]